MNQTIRDFIKAMERAKKPHYALIVMALFIVLCAMPPIILALK